MRDERLTQADELALERLLAGESTADERRHLQARAIEIPELREYLSLHDGLATLEDDLGLPSDREFTAMRRRVLREVRPRRLAVLGAALTAFFRQPVLAGGLAALLIAAAGVGWWAAGDGRQTLPMGDAWLADLGETAKTHHRLADVEDSPWRYSNVDFRDGLEGGVELNFDVTRHVSLTRERHDPLVAEAMAQSMLNESRPAQRLRTLGFAEGGLTPKVRQAMMFAMLNDPEAAVRMKAQSLLLESPRDNALDEAFSAVLAGEQSVQMRLVALDYFAAGGMPLDGDLADLLLQAGDAAQPLLVHAADQGLLPQGAR